MDRSFRFRYASEVAGGFVVLALLLLVAGIFLAGRSQGWFEGNFILRSQFATAEGSFGLREGSEVMIRNTLAGRVGKIMPMQSGQLETTLVIKERFRPFVRRGAVAKVKKKFGLAGDSFVEITMGNGPILNYGDLIDSATDEEIMVKVQNVLTNLQGAIVPMVNEVHQILKKVNGILGSVEEGQGLVGAIVKDKGMADETRGTLVSAHQAIRDAGGVLTNVSAALVDIRSTLEEARSSRGAIGNATAVLTNATAVLGEVQSTLRDIRSPQGVVGNANAVLTNASAVLSEFRSQKGVMGHANGVLSEAQNALRETTRLIQGAQRHWLLRKYVPKEEAGAGPTLGTRAGAAPSEGERLRAALDEARKADEAAGIARNATALAGWLLAAGEYREIGGLLAEARDECAVTGRNPAETYLIEAELDRRLGRVDAGIVAGRTALHLYDDSGSNEARSEGHLLLAEIYCATGRTAEAQQEAASAKALLRKSESLRHRAALAEVDGTILLSQGKPGPAAGQFDAAADLYRKDGSYVEMSEAVHRAGLAYDAAGDDAAASDRFFRSARSLLSSGLRSEAEPVVRKALAAARKAGRADLAARVERLLGAGGASDRAVP